MSSKLFSPLALRGLTLANRIVVSPMGQYNSRDGSATDWHLMHLGQFSIGGFGLVMTEVTSVNMVGRVSHCCAGIWSDENEAALKRVIDFCREYGVAALGLQIGHSGRKGSTTSMFDGPRPLTKEAGGWQTVAPSAIPFAPDWQTPRALTAHELDTLVDEFAAAVRRAERIGFDLVELHGGHGYLIHQFLSPLSNQRTDEYGGTLANRMRFPLKVFAAMRAAWPPDKPMGIRISATDWIEGSWDVEEAIVFVRELKRLGCDYVDVSSGALDLRQKIPLGPGYQVPLSATIRAATGLPTMAVGLITDARQADQIVGSGQADLVAMGRGAMWNPRWPWHAAEELGGDAPYAKRSMPCHPCQRPYVFPRRRVSE